MANIQLQDASPSAPPPASPSASSGGNPWDAYTNHPFYQQITQAYQRYFGRTPGGSEVWDRLGNGQGLTEPNLQRQLNDISHYYQAPDYRDRGAGYVPPAPAAPTGSSPFDVNSIGQAWLGSGGRTNQDWLNFYNQHPELASNGYTVQQGNKPGELIGPNGTGWDTVIASGMGGTGASWTPFGSASGGGSMPPLQSSYAAQFSDPSTKRLEEYVNQLMGKLQQPPFSGQEQEVLRTQALEPIERDRTAAHQRALNNIGARGFDPSSGIAQELLNNVDRGFDTSRAQAQNQLAYNTIGQSHANDQQVLSLLQLLYQLPRNSMNDALAVLNQQPNYSGLVNGYAQLGAMNNANSAASGQWLGSLLAILLGGH